VYHNKKRIKVDDIEAIAVFPVPKGNDAVLETANRWAGKDAKTKDWGNPILQGVRIIDIEKRVEGGRAWKVIYSLDYPEKSDGYFLVDLREDVLLDVIKTQGIAKGGILNGYFIWVQLGSQMKLVRNHSELYEDLVVYMETKKVPKIKKSELKVGYLYESVNGNQGMYLGDVTYKKFVSRIIGETWSSKLIGFTTSEKVTAPLWLEVPNWFKIGVDVNYWYLKPIQKHSFMKCVREIVPAETVANYISQYKVSCLQGILEAGNKYSNSTYQIQEKIGYINSYGWITSIVPKGEEPVLVPQLLELAEQYPRYLKFEV